MASSRCVANVLSFLLEQFPTRTVTEATAAAWEITFADWSDAELERCAQAAAREPGRQFFPTPGEIRAHGPRPASVSATELLRKIVALGHEGPHFEWVLPSVERVRECLGDGIAAAYGAVGPHRLNSDNPTTREIAERDFAEALEGVPEPVRAEGLALPSGGTVPALGAGPVLEESAVDRWYAEQAKVSRRVQPPDAAE